MIIDTSPLSLTNYGEYEILNTFFKAKYTESQGAEPPPSIYAHLCDFSPMIDSNKPYKLEKFRILFDDLVNEGYATEPSQAEYEPFELPLTKENWTLSLSGSDYKATSKQINFTSKSEAFDEVTHLVLTLGKKHIIAYSELTAPLTISANDKVWFTASVTYKDASGSSGLFSEGSRIVLECFFHALDRLNHIKTLTSRSSRFFEVALFSDAPSQTDKIGDLSTEPDAEKDSPKYFRYGLPIDSWNIQVLGRNYEALKVLSKPVYFENKGSVSDTERRGIRDEINRGQNKSWLPVSYAVLIYHDYTGVLYPIDYTALTGAPITLAPGERIDLKYEFKQQ